MTIRDVSTSPKIQQQTPLDPSAKVRAEVESARAKKETGPVDAFDDEPTLTKKRGEPPMPSSSGNFDYNAAAFDGRYHDGPSLAQVQGGQALRIGHRGEGVRDAQAMLNRFGAGLDQDGLLGPKTQQAIRDFQRAVGLPETGELDPKTLQALQSAEPSSLQVEWTDKAAAAQAARARVEAREDLEALGYPVGDDPSRHDDATTKSSIERFQRESGLPATGEFDLETMMALLQANDRNRSAGKSASPRRNSAWSSGRPGASGGPRSRNGFSSPQGDFSGARAAQGDNSRASTGPAPLGRVDLSTEQGRDVFRQAARLAGVPESWADSPAMRSLVNRESGGVVGRLNYTYGNRNMTDVHNELKNGRITARSSATGLGQLLLSNVDRYYPNGRAGIGDPVQEAAGMMRYIKDRYGSPEVAWGNHSANPNRHQGVPRIYTAEGY